jgi:PAS domain S-box-containing protein
MAIDNLSKRVSELSQHLEELQAKYVNNPANAPEILSDLLESLQASIEKLSAAKEELKQRNEERLGKLTRLYAVLSKVNEAIVRTDDIESLYTDACHIVADIGGFPLVWIGHVKEQQVVPLAWSGPATGYLKDIKVEVQGEFGQGPTGTCIRENRAVVNDDFATNSATLPWREMALRYGIRASAAFPLRNKGKVIGAFTLYAYEPNTFDDEQVELLQSLSSDISYALEALDQEQLRVRAEGALRELNAELEQRVVNRTAELIKTDEKVRAERQRFLDVLDTLPVIVDIIRPDHHIEWTNRTYREALGDNQGRLCFESQFGRDKPCEECQAFMPLDTGQPQNWEWTLPNGRTFDIYDFPFADADGSPMILEMDIDITDRKRLAEALQASSAYNRSLIEASLDPLVTIGIDGKITDVNEATVNVTGVPRKQLIGTDFSDYFTEPEKARAGYQQVFAKGFVKDYPLTILHKNGSLKDVLYNASIYKDIQGRVLGAFAAARDVTERRRAEIELDNYRKHLEDLVRERTHELEDANLQLADDNEELAASNEELRATTEELQIGIENRIRTEEALRASDARLNTAIETVREGVIIATEAEDVIYWNPAARALHGFTKPGEGIEPLSDTPKTFDLIYPDTGRVLPLEDWPMKRIKRGEKVSNFELLLRRPDKGWVKYVSYSGTMVETPSGEHLIFLTVYDLTERKQAEEALRESEERLNLAQRAAGSGVWDWNVITGNIKWSKELFDLFGVDHQKTFASFDTWNSVLHPEDREIANSRIEKALSEHVDLDSEYRLIKPNGEVRWINALGRGIYDNQGRPIRMIGICIDVTERKQADQALRKANEELADANEELAASNEELRATTEELQKAHSELEFRVQERTAELSDAKENLEVINEELQVEISEHQKTEKELMAAKEAAEAAVEAKAAFLANMSHELRTPLNAIIGYSSLLLDDDLTQEQREHIESIKNGGEAQLAIISEILEFSRAEKEKITLEHQPFSLKRCIEESMDMVAVQADKKGLNLAYTISYGTPDTIIGDPGRLRQVLVNLLNNAVKFTDIGDISVSISSKALEGNKHQITFAVKDTGIGMPQEKMDRIFEPFTQLEYIISRKRDGTGLGLAISKKLVELMGGKIWAESGEGKGSTFRFTIQANTTPGKHLDLGEKDRSLYKNLSVEKPLSILVAEDNPSNQRVLVEMLKRLGYRPDAVADGAEVLQALKIRPYDLIFMDIRMQEMDGLTATREIRRLWPEKGPMVVAITAFAMEGDQEMCIKAGMNDYIAKPVKLGDLAEVLDKCQPHKNS